MRHVLTRIIYCVVIFHNFPCGHYITSHSSHRNRCKTLNYSIASSRGIVRGETDGIDCHIRAYFRDLHNGKWVNTRKRENRQKFHCWFILFWRHLGFETPNRTERDRISHNMNRNGVIGRNMCYYVHSIRFHQSRWRGATKPTKTMPRTEAYEWFWECKSYQQQ